jgi:hypothetical protein
LLAALRPGTRDALTASAALVGADPFLLPTGLGSPWSPSDNLQSVVVEDILGAKYCGMSRGQAMRIPAVARARHIIAGTIARIDLGAYRGEDRLDSAAEPSWLSRTDGPLSPFHRMLWTVDDLIFYGWSLWQITARSADSTGGFPLAMDRVPMGQWTLEPGTGRVLVYQPDGLGGWAMRPAAPGRNYVLIPGGTEGLLAEGLSTLHHAADLERSAHNAARHPSAYLGLKQTSGTPLKLHSDDATEVTVETILSGWRTARHNPEGGGVAWLGGVDPVELGSFESHMLETGRNLAAVDVARHASIPADLIDATIPESSLHYKTSRDNDRRFIDYGLGLHMGAISGRLSQNDVTPNGQRVAFDLEEWLAGEAPMTSSGAPIPGMAQPADDSQETPQ